MKFCQHCGAQLSEGTRFCESCGARVEEETSIEVNSSTGGNSNGPMNTTGISKRNIVVAIILTIITCGIYNIYWMIKLNNELLQMSGKEGPSGGMVFFLSLITCGIYTYVWYWKMGDCVDTINNKKQDLSTSVIFILLAVFGFGFVNYILAQNTINDHVSE
jgi:amino acid transporter